MISHSFSCNGKISYLYHLDAQHTNEQHMGPGQGRVGWPSQHGASRGGRQNMEGKEEMQHSELRAQSLNLEEGGC